MTKLRFKNVTKHYGEGATGLRQFSLNVDTGELVVLVGPSGCGKSTALRLLAGLETVSSGEILIDDVVVNHMTPQQRNIAMVFQNYALYPHMNVRDNLAFPLRMAHLSRAQIADRVNEIAQILNLTELLHRRPKQLSGGQRQRVAMGRALVRDPRVFLLDEPLSNLDARLRAQIRADIARIQQRLQKTTVYVTHDQVEAMTLGDRVAVMDHGELQQVGTPTQLYAQPGNIFVARFIGSPGMNIAPSTATLHNDAMAVRIGDLSIRLPMSEQRRLQIARHDKVGYIGVRPEAFSLTKADQRIAIKIGIQSVEYLGHESLIYFHVSEADTGTDDELWIARISGCVHHASGQNMELYVDPDAIYLFDRKGGTVETA
ncbi:MAG: ABC transporter ATP-binding protein [Gammaproteobacteria bacterium]